MRFPFPVDKAFSFRPLKGLLLKTKSDKTRECAKKISVSLRGLNVKMWGRILSRKIRGSLRDSKSRLVKTNSENFLIFPNSSKFGIYPKLEYQRE